VPLIRSSKIITIKRAVHWWLNSLWSCQFLRVNPRISELKQVRTFIRNLFSHLYFSFSLNSIFSETRILLLLFAPPVWVQFFPPALLLILPNVQRILQLVPNTHHGPDLLVVLGSTIKIFLNSKLYSFHEIYWILFTAQVWILNSFQIFYWKMFEKYDP